MTDQLDIDLFTRDLVALIAPAYANFEVIKTPEVELVRPPRDITDELPPDGYAHFAAGPLIHIHIGEIVLRYPVPVPTQEVLIP